MITQDPGTDDLLLASLARKAAQNGEARRLREAASLGLGEVAHALGVDAITLSRWERGLNSPRGARAIAYGRLLIELAVAAGTAA